MEQKVLYFEDLEVGRQTVSARRTITESDIVGFAGLSGDFNPLHMDEEFAKTTPFGKRIAHGMLGLSVMSGLPGMEPPWRILAFMSLDWKFSKPVFIGDTIHFVGEVTRRKAAGSDRGIVVSERKLINQREEVVGKGSFTLLVSRRPGA